MKKFASILLAGLMALSLFAGCSSEVTSTDDGSSAAQASSSGTESQAESNGGSEDAYAGLSGTLTLNGSTSMTAVCNALGEAFMAKYDGVTVEKANTGSGSAVTAVNDGTALIGDLSRKVKDDEDPDGKFTKVTIALDGIAIAVNPENPVDALTSEQIEKIFAGEITNWSEVGGDDAAITVIGREEGSGTIDGFENIFGFGEDKKCAYAAEVQETGIVVSKVASDPSAIGYVSLASVNDEIKAVSVDGVEATEENVSNGTYVVQRPFVQIYTKGTDSELVKAWFDFLKSDEGQQIIADQKLVTVDIDENTENQ